jgi:hypothetical protein
MKAPVDAAERAACAEGLRVGAKDTIAACIGPAASDKIV